MKFALAAFGIATLVGVGYVIGKKVLEKKDGYDESDIDFGEPLEPDEFAETEDLPNDGEPSVYAQGRYDRKIRKASMFAVGAIKTGADKFGETLKDIKTKDMVKKGQDTLDSVKVTGENIKNDIKRDIEDLKSMVSSINNEEKEPDAEDLFEESVDSAESIFDSIDNDTPDDTDGANA